MSLWRIFNEAMNYEHRISGWWLLIIIQSVLVLGGLMEVLLP